MIAAPPVGLSVSPPRLEVAAAAAATVELRNPGNSEAVVAVAAARYALDAAGRPRVVDGRDGIRLSVRPSVLSLAAGGTGAVVVTSHAAAGARPGDHPELVVFTLHPSRRAPVGVTLRVAVPVVVRVGGSLVRRLVVERVRPTVLPRPPAIRVDLRNRGNVVEHIAAATLGIRLVRRGHVVARLLAPPRELLPGARATLRLACPRRLRGRFDVVVRTQAAPSRSWPVRLP